MIDLSAESLRWLIGGGIAGVATALAGIGWLIRMAYRIGGTLTSIEARLGSHGELHAQHAARLDDIDHRLQRTEQAVARHSGQLEAL